MRTISERQAAFGGRLVKLSNGEQGLCGGITPQIRVHAGGEPIIDFIASDETLDRYAEVISADGWDLGSYRKNPVFLNSHRYDDIAFTLGKSIFHEASGGKLHQRIRFAVDVNPVAKLAFELYRGGYLNAVSVGFVPLEWEDGNRSTAWKRKFLKQELLELSAVSIPANPNAVQMCMKSGAIGEGDVRDAIDLLAGYAKAAGDHPAGRTLNEEIAELQWLLRSA